MRLVIDYPSEMHDSFALATAFHIADQEGGFHWMKPNEQYWMAEKKYGVWVSANRKDTVTITMRKLTEEFENEHPTE